MRKNKTDIEADTNKPSTPIESPSMMEPMLIASSSRYRQELADLAIELAASSAGFCHSLPEAIATALADLVRAMNCYYSNLIEGHNTHPVDIERALKSDYSSNAEKRNLQHEAKAHIIVQQWIDEGGLNGMASTCEGICSIHKHFGEHLPDEFLWVEDTDTGKKVRLLPGELRKQHVKVGQHIAVSPKALPRFLERFENAYSNLGKSETIISAAAAHHRLLWIHPFLDGNGRVARLMSYAMLRESLGNCGLWSVARGLARNAQAYKNHLAACDLPRRNDFDGRGNLSEEELVSFTRFFLETCIDQVKFMEGLLQPKRLRNRILLWAEEEIRAGTLPARATRLLDAMLYNGEVLRRNLATILDTSDRQARRIVSALSKQGVIVSSSSRAPLRLAFPAGLAYRWLPGLFPEN